MSDVEDLTVVEFEKRRIEEEVKEKTRRRKQIEWRYVSE